MLKKVLIIIGVVVAVLIIGFVLAGIIKPAFKDTVTVIVNAPASKTFAVFNNTDNMGKWMNGFKSIKNVSGEKNQVGSKWKLEFDENGRDLVLNETVTSFEQDKHFAFDMEDEFATFHVDVRFEENNGQTTITQVFEGTGKGVIARSMIAIMSSSIQKQNVEMYNRLKALVENS